MRPFDLSAENTEDSLDCKDQRNSLTEHTDHTEDSTQNTSRDAVQLNKIMRIHELDPVKECLEMTARTNKENDENMMFYEQIADVHDLNDSREVERQNVILRVIKMNLWRSTSRCLQKSTRRMTSTRSSTSRS